MQKWKQCSVSLQNPIVLYTVIWSSANPGYACWNRICRPSELQTLFYACLAIGSLFGLLQFKPRIQDLGLGSKCGRFLGRWIWSGHVKGRIQNKYLWGSSGQDPGRERKYLELAVGLTIMVVSWYRGIREILNPATQVRGRLKPADCPDVKKPPSHVLPRPGLIAG